MNNFQFSFFPRSCILFFLPFFTVEAFGFIQFILSTGVKLCCSVISSQVMERLVSKCNLLFFIGNKDTTGRQQILCLESAKLFFGTGPQLCFQLWMLGASSSPSVTQYLSIVSSFLLGTKSAYQLLTYSREEEGSEWKNQKNGWKAKFSSLPKDLKKVFMNYLSWLPLILISLLYKIGSINLYLKFFGLYSIIIIFLIIVLNVLGSFILNILMDLEVITLNPSLSIWSKGLPIDEEKSRRLLDNLFISFTNMFVISRPFNTIRK